MMKDDLFAFIAEEENPQPPRLSRDEAIKRLGMIAQSENIPVNGEEIWKSVADGDWYADPQSVLQKVIAHQLNMQAGILSIGDNREASDMERLSLMAGISLPRLSDDTPVADEPPESNVLPSHTPVDYINMIASKLGDGSPRIINNGNNAIRAYHILGTDDDEQVKHAMGYSPALDYGETANHVIQVGKIPIRSQRPNDPVMDRLAVAIFGPRGSKIDSASEGEDDISAINRIATGYLRGPENVGLSGVDNYQSHLKRSGIKERFYNQYLGYGHEEYDVPHTIEKITQLNDKLGQGLTISEDDKIHVVITVNRMADLLKLSIPQWNHTPEDYRSMVENLENSWGYNPNSYRNAGNRFYESEWKDHIVNALNNTNMQARADYEDVNISQSYLEDAFFPWPNLKQKRLVVFLGKLIRLFGPHILGYIEERNPLASALEGFNTLRRLQGR